MVKQKRGFALLSQARLKELAAQGGRKTQTLGKGHRWDHESGNRAGKIGGAHKHHGK